MLQICWRLWDATIEHHLRPALVCFNSGEILASSIAVMSSTCFGSWLKLKLSRPKRGLREWISESFRSSAEDQQCRIQGKPLQMKRSQAWSSQQQISYMNRDPAHMKGSQTLTPTSQLQISCAECSPHSHPTWIGLEALNNRSATWIGAHMKGSQTLTPTSQRQISCAECSPHSHPSMSRPTSPTSSSAWGRVTGS